MNKNLRCFEEIRKYRTLIEIWNFWRAVLPATQGAIPAVKRMFQAKYKDTPTECGFSSKKPELGHWFSCFKKCLFKSCTMQSSSPLQKEILRNFIFVAEAYEEQLPNLH